jgi:hypothetical protein
MRRALISLVAALALVGVGYAFSHSAPVHAPNPAEQAQAVKLVTPQPGDLDLRQVKISAQLASGYTGTLLYDGAEVPQDDISVVSALNTVTLEPQPDSHYKTLTPGQHCATVVYWPVAEGRSSAASHRWCFSLH